MSRTALLLVVLTLGFTSRVARAGPDDVVIPQEHVDAALSEAKANRPELEQVLKHFEAGATAGGKRLAAARFLVANMPGKGYIVTVLKDKKGNVVPYDPLAYPDF